MSAGPKRTKPLAAPIRSRRRARRSSNSSDAITPLAPVQRRRASRAGERGSANAGKEERPVLPADLARDPEPLDLVGALVDLGDLGIAHHSLDRVLLDVPV